VVTFERFCCASGQSCGPSRSTQVLKRTNTPHHTVLWNSRRLSYDGVEITFAFVKTSPRFLDHHHFCRSA
jgi:hypothetical protein